MVESVTLTARTPGLAARTVVLDRPLSEAAAPVTGRRLLTVGDPYEVYPVPPPEVFDDGDPLEFINAPDLEAIAAAVIAERGPLQWLVKERIAYLWKEQGGASGGKDTYGKCIRSTGLVRFYGRHGFVVWLAADHCRDAYFKRWQIEALVTHELLHCDQTDKDKLTIRPHDFQGFNSELAWYGPWHTDLRSMRRVVAQMPLFDGDDLDGGA